LASLYGPGDLRWWRLIPATIRTVLGGGNPEIAGDGSAACDWLYVEDAVDGCLKLAEHLPDQTGEAFNLGTARPVAALDVVRQLQELAGNAVRSERAPQDPTVYPIDAWMDSSKASRRLGWTPGTGLANGLARSIDWYRDYLSFGKVVVLEPLGV
jgi:nucleoside-diphosphate-sugar epimerase